MITGQAKLTGVIGWPISHSKSPLIHNYWLEQRGLDGAYLPLACPPDELASVVSSLKTLGFVGWNVTIPHKQTIMAQLDALSPAAQQIQAVNTVYRDEQGRYIGDNSDAFGFQENLCSQADQEQFTRGDALILGAGGAARAIVYALLGMNFSRIFIANRTFARAAELAADFHKQAGTRCELTPLDWQLIPEQARSCSLVVNTTALGMTGQPALELDLSRLPKSACVNDIVYNPLQTALLAWAQARGSVCVGGLGMLLHQARSGFARWYGCDLPQIDQALEARVLAG